jgi:hypothetical protein
MNVETMTDIQALSQMAVLKTRAAKIATSLHSSTQLLEKLSLTDAFATVDQIRHEADSLQETFAEYWDLAKRFGLSPADTRSAIA